MQKIFTELDQISLLELKEFYIYIECIITKKKSTQKNQLKVELLEEEGYLNEIILDCVP